MPHGLFLRNVTRMRRLTVTDATTEMHVVSTVLENPCCIVKGLSFDLCKEKNSSSKGITEKKVCRMGCFCERDSIHVP